MAQKVRLKKSNTQNKIPSANTMDFGEVYVNYASGVGKSFLATKKYDGTVAQFMEKGYNDSTYSTKAEASEYAAAALANANFYSDGLFLPTVTGATMSNTATQPSVSNHILTIPTVQGYQGRQGWQGYQGPRGYQGNQGFQGYQGPRGYQGNQGFQGYQGPRGYQGNQGFQGWQGWQGYQGPRGYQGFQGRQGWQGYQGPRGYQGNQGFQGWQGWQGYQGPTGPVFNVTTASTKHYLLGINSTASTTIGTGTVHSNKVIYTENGVLVLSGNNYTDTGNTGALNLSNSDIFGVNSIKFADKSDGASEGLQWFRDATHADSLWVKDGVLYITPNRQYGTAGTQYRFWNEGNDGADSGLDADLLDGKHASYFAISANTYNALQAIPESSLVKGTKNLSGDLYVGDHIYNEYASANRLSGLKAAGITVEYTIDGGTTWVDYGATALQKRNLFTNRAQSFKLGGIGHNATDKSGHWLRVIVDTSQAGVYTTLSKFNIFMTTNYSTGCTVTIDAALQNDPTNYSKVICTNQPINGWSGWNTINYPNGVTTYGNTASSQYGRLRFTFKQGGLSNTAQSAQGATIISIFGYGGMGWTTPSNMALNGHAYSYDGDMNVSFPNNVHANSLSVTSTGSVANLNADLLDGKHLNQVFDSISYNNDVLSVKVGGVEKTATIGTNYVTGATMSNTATQPSVSNHILTIPTVQGYQGYQGRQGWQGYQGPRGYQGNQGFQGWQGWQGYQGPRGYQGNQGFQGRQGWQGYQGPRGYQGNQGFQGRQGWQGYQGPKGYQGNQGFQGWQGWQGYQGPRGYQGNQGFQGRQGWQGYQGPRGYQGNQGFQGWQGWQGYQGPRGYQGNQGFQGRQGWQGYQGPTGPVFNVTTASTKHYLLGLNATSATIGSTTMHTTSGAYVENGKLYADIPDLTTLSSSVITNYATKAEASEYAVIALENANDYTDEQFLPTVTGAQMSNTATQPSVSNHILTIPTVQGYQGYQGRQGYQGPIGPQGRQGWQGYQGPIGPQGRQGWQGYQGPIGPQGRQGWQGYQGPIGPQGRQGWQGYQGPIGPQGRQGWQGYQGPIGPQGRQGWQGYQGPTGPVFNITTASTKHYLLGLNATSATIGNSTTHTTTGAYVENGKLYADIPDLTALSSSVITNYSTKAEASEYAAAALANAIVYTDELGARVVTGAVMSNTATQPSVSNNILTIPTVQGYQGYQGRQGYQGPIGYQGNQGFQGRQGWQGYQGPRGYQGNQGFQGRQGWQGYQGPMGYQGNQGFQGRQGYQGPTGPVFNVTTASTKHYLLGLNATSATIGNSTMHTTSGAYVENGKLYADIPDLTTLSSSVITNYATKQEVIDNEYVVAQSLNDLNNSINELSEIVVTGAQMSNTATQPSVSNNVLTIPTVQGYQGYQGRQGYQGPKGADSTVRGFQGYQGYQGPKGADSTVRGFQGYQGYQGPKGSDSTVQGPRGYQGYQGYQGPKGADSTVRGFQGYQGYQGPKGADSTVRGFQGYQGYQGPKGSDSTVQGPDGPRGYQGYQGRQGYQGPRGENGTNGTNGTNGRQGYQGYQGRQGYQGPKGETGSSGPAFTVTTANTQHYLLGLNATSATISQTTVHTNSSVYMTGGLIYSLSDENLKNFIGDIRCNLDDIKKIPKMYFKWKDSETDDVEIGTSAQELMKYYPEIVNYDSNTCRYSVSYERLSIIALAAIDKLNIEIQKLKDEINLLKEK